MGASTSTSIRVSDCGLTLMTMLFSMTVFLCLTVDADIDYACLEAKIEGNCDGSFQRYYFDPQLVRCLNFTYTGCWPNRNNFYTLEACERRCVRGEGAPDYTGLQVCQLPFETGLCRGFYPRYFYNHHDGRCERFGWGGCGGNYNNFRSEDACLIACFGH